jgi:hypothetical protein
MAGHTAAALGHAVDFAFFNIQTGLHYCLTDDIACPQNPLSADTCEQYAFHFIINH